jgi:hypothetical protein
MAAAAAAVVMVAGPALADWEPWDPYKYQQLPDTGTAGEPPHPTAVAVNISDQIVADDFPCTARGAVTELHFWGAWDPVPQNQPPTMTGYRIGFHADIPATETEPSQPGHELWMHDVDAQYVQVQKKTLTIGYWYYPKADPHWRQSKWDCYQFNVDLEAFAEEHQVDLFVQEGTVAAPKTYWLSLQGMYLNPPPSPDQIGWLTTAPGAYMDDAAWLDPQTYTGGEPEPDSWAELIYPPNQTPLHPFAAQSMEMSFVLVTRESMPIPEPAGLGLIGALLLGLRKRQ